MPLQLVQGSGKPVRADQARFVGQDDELRPVSHAELGHGNKGASVTATPVQDASSVARQRRQRISAASFGLVILLLAQYVPACVPLPIRSMRLLAAFRPAPG